MGLCGSVLEYMVGGDTNHAVEVNLSMVAVPTNQNVVLKVYNNLGMPHEAWVGLYALLRAGCCPSCGPHCLKQSAAADLGLKDWQDYNTLFKLE